VALTIPVERIGDKARTAEPGKVLLTVLVAVLYVPGWVAGKLWLALAWAGAAVMVGWQDARRPRVEPGRAARR
jgi:hypothetical protein